MPSYTVTHLHTCVDRFRVNADTPELALKKVQDGLVETDDTEVVSSVEFEVYEGDTVVLTPSQCDKLLEGN